MKKFLMIIGLMFLASQAYANCEIAVTDNNAVESTQNVGTVKCDELAEAIEADGRFTGASDSATILNYHR